MEEGEDSEEEEGQERTEKKLWYFKKKSQLIWIEYLIKKLPMYL